jgi:glutathione peroxidase
MGLYDRSAARLDGTMQHLVDYEGKVSLIVNVASECGYTPQYRGLQSLYEQHRDRGFAVLGFPCNQFGAQEPGNPDEIQRFCEQNYRVSFPLFAKVDVKGAGQSPIYAFLTAQHGEPRWNFHKYLVGKDGEVIAAYPSSVEPDAPELLKAIDTALA